MIVQRLYSKYSNFRNLEDYLLSLGHNKKIVDEVISNRGKTLEKVRELNKKASSSNPLLSPVLKRHAKSYKQNASELNKFLLKSDLDLKTPIFHLKDYANLV